MHQKATDGRLFERLSHPAPPLDLEGPPPAPVRIHRSECLLLLREGCAYRPFVCGCYQWSRLRSVRKAKPETDTLQLCTWGASDELLKILQPGDPGYLVRGSSNQALRPIALRPPRTAETIRSTPARSHPGNGRLDDQIQEDLSSSII